MLKKVFALLLSTIKGSPIIRVFISWCVLLLGLIVWITVQSYLIHAPLTQRDQLPEVDDSLAYLTRAQVMDECLSLDCKALVDLKNQFNAMPGDPEIQRQSEIAGFAFPLYHPMFSAILLSLNKINHDLISTYRILWALSPLFLGVAFACFLTSLWGRTATGITLFLVAFKVFPDTGTHYFTPSSLVLIIALFIWARIVSKNGFAPITLTFGSLILLAIHPIGILFSLIGVAIGLFLAEKRKQLCVSLILFSITCVIICILTSVAGQFYIYLTVFPLQIFTNITGIATTVIYNLIEIAIQFTRYKVALFGPLIILFPSVVLGFFFLEKKRQKKMVIVLTILFVVLLSSLFHSHALTPNASLFFRIFIPIQVVLFGAVANLIYIMFTNILGFPEKEVPSPPINHYSPKSPLVSKLILVLLCGYILETIIPGMEQIQMVREYMIKRQPLSFNKNQPQILLSKAKKEDIVLYTSTIIMASYFIHNCMKLGAVYYHPAFAQSEEISTLLRQKNLKFAAVYNPAVYHPTYVGLDEKDSCITSPELTFSPLSEARKFGPISQEGVIPAKNYHWIGIYPKNHENIERLKVYVNNPGKQTEIELIEQVAGMTETNQSGNRRSISANWNGWVTFPLVQKKQGDTYKLILPPGNTKVSIGGISFDDTHFWPWSHHATLVLQGKNAATGTVQLSYNPSDLLPPEIKRKPVTVIHDQGSSVLLEFTQ